jgi:hypothetical protein
MRSKNWSFLVGSAVAVLVGSCVLCYGIGTSSVFAQDPGGVGAEMWSFCDETVAANCVAFPDVAICGFANPNCLAVNPNEDPVHPCMPSIFPMWCDFKAGVLCAGLCQVNGADCSRVDFSKCQ